PGAWWGKHHRAFRWAATPDVPRLSREEAAGPLRQAGRGAVSERRERQRQRGLRRRARVPAVQVFRPRNARAHWSSQAESAWLQRSKQALAAARWRKLPWPNAKAARLDNHSLCRFPERGPLAANAAQRSWPQRCKVAKWFVRRRWAKEGHHRRANALPREQIRAAAL